MLSCWWGIEAVYEDGAACLQAACKAKFSNFKSALFVCGFIENEKKSLKWFLTATDMPCPLYEKRQNKELLVPMLLAFSYCREDTSMHVPGIIIISIIHCAL